MKKKTRLICISLALTAILLVATGSAAAKETRREFTGMHFLCATSGIEKIWSTGSPLVEHVRGMHWTGRAVSDEPLYNADSAGIHNYNLNMATGSGGIHGTFVKYVDDMDGAWEGTYAGKFVDGIGHTKVVGHGTGELAGMKYFATFTPIVPPPQGQDSPCVGLTLGADAVSGVILETGGH